MSPKVKILIAAFLLLTFRFFAQPPAPGDPVEEPLSIDRGLIVLFIAGVLFGLYSIRKRIKLYQKYDQDLKKYTKSLKSESSKKTISNHLK